VSTKFIPTKRANWVRDKLGVDLPAEYPAESYPGFAAPVIVKSHQTGLAACGLAKFGLIPFGPKIKKSPVTPTTPEVKLRQRNPATEMPSVSANLDWCL